MFSTNGSLKKKLTITMSEFVDYLHTACDWLISSSCLINKQYPCTDIIGCEGNFDL